MEKSRTSAGIHHLQFLDLGKERRGLIWTSFQFSTNLKALGEETEAAEKSDENMKSRSRSGVQVLRIWHRDEG